MARKHQNLVIAAVSVLPLLAACGNARPLVAKAGESLPPKPYAARETPDSTTLLETSTQARPGRTVELRRRSELRDNDEFDMPPEQ